MTRYNLAMLLLLACAAPPEANAGRTRDTAAVGDTVGAGDTASDTPSDTPSDTGAGGTGGAFACPAGMVGVPTESPAWCIDAYEVTAVDGVPTLAAGTEPTVGVTYEDAAAACAASPAVDAGGAAYAMRHLATAEEWEDAGDGTLGEGGLVFPWGDTFDDTRCVTLTSDGVLQFDGLQPTGSMPECVSGFGLYDMVGNAWEWTDSGVTLDADAALAALATPSVSRWMRHRPSASLPRRVTRRRRPRHWNA